jgi:hypothetical protein
LAKADRAFKLTHIQMIFVTAPGAWDAKKLLELARSETKQDRRILSGFQNSPLWLQYFPVSANRPKSVRKVSFSDRFDVFLNDLSRQFKSF